MIERSVGQDEPEVAVVLAVRRRKGRTPVADWTSACGLPWENRGDGLLGCSVRNAAGLERQVLW